MDKAVIVSVSKSKTHTFSKFLCDEITLIKGMGVEGDAHMGSNVKHRSRVARDPNQPNLRQVHLMDFELLNELNSRGFQVESGQMGENILTRGIELLKLPKDTILSIGKNARILITGLRNPCKQLDSIQEGLMKALLDRDEEGNLIRKAGIMAVVLEGGQIKHGDNIKVELPKEPYISLERV